MDYFLAVVQVREFCSVNEILKREHIKELKGVHWITLGTARFTRAANEPPIRVPLQEEYHEIIFDRASHPSS
jgi:hypothetical protein